MAAKVIPDGRTWSSGAMNDAAKNVEYLQILEKPCEELRDIAPDDIPQHLPKIINAIRFIWLHSPGYNSREQVTGLFKCLSNLVIMQCQKHIDCVKGFDGQPLTAIRQIRSCMNCITMYRAMYDTIAEAHAEGSKHGWNLDRTKIFAYTDIFIQRCKDIADVFNAMTVFARINEEEEIEKPQFGGCDGLEIEKMIDAIENSFMDELAGIKKNHSRIFDIYDSDWNEQMSQFRSNLKDLEARVDQLFETAFLHVNNLEEALETLQGLYHFSKRDSLYPCFVRKTEYVYKFLKDEIVETTRLIIDEEDDFPAAMPYHSGRAMGIMMKKRCIIQLKELLNKAEWLPACDYATEVNTRYENFIQYANNRIDEIFKKWADWATNLDVAKRLSRPLLCVSASRPGWLECNMDRGLLRVNREAKYWRLLKKSLPKSVIKLYKKQHTLRATYNNVVAVIQDYNNIVSSLSEDERALFKELLVICSKKLAPGLSKLRWNSEASDIFINDCLAHTTELQEFIDEFKDANLEISRLCEKICESRLVPPLDQCYTLLDLKILLEEHREQVLIEIVHLYQQICHCLLVAYEGFRDHIFKVAAAWHTYILRMDSMVEYALKYCVQSSLGVMVQALTKPSAPIITVDAYLKRSQILFEPTLFAISRLMAGMLPNIVDSLHVFPRIHERFQVPSDGRDTYHVTMQMDEDIHAEQLKINNAVGATSEGMKHFFNIWEPYKSLWEIKMNVFLEEYSHAKPTYTTFCTDIDRYIDQKVKLQGIEINTKINFLSINSSRLQEAAIKHCVEWKTRMIELLYQASVDLLQEAYEYIEINTERMEQKPENLNELRNIIILQEILQEEAPKIEKKFPIIEDYFKSVAEYEYEITSEDEQRLANLEEEWQKYLKVLEQSIEMVNESKKEFNAKLLEESVDLRKEVFALNEEFIAKGPYSSEWTTKDALEYIRKLYEKLRQLHALDASLRDDLTMFNATYPPITEFDTIERRLEDVETAWLMAKELEDMWEYYRTASLMEVNGDELQDKVLDFFEKAVETAERMYGYYWEILEHTRIKADEIRKFIPVVIDLKNSAMNIRHWNQIHSLVTEPFDEQSPEFTLDVIKKMGFRSYADQIAEISNAATMEHKIEIGLKAIAEEWKDMELEFTPHKDLFRLKPVDDIFQHLEDNLVALSAMRCTKFVEPFIVEADYWEKTLTTIMKVLEMMLVVQRQFLYLENVFLAEDIRKQLPMETDAFDKVTSGWTEITSMMNVDRNVVLCSQYSGLLQTLNGLNESLENIQRALEAYLETKRRLFPRFYFISNDDLLDILGQSKNPEGVQPHLKKCFDNINKIKIELNTVTNKQEAVGMYSAESEYIQFTNVIILEGAVEMWLCELEKEMRITLRDQMKQVRASLLKNLTEQDKWIRNWPGQMCITSSQIQWTADCTRALMQCKVIGNRKPTKKLRRRRNRLLARYSDAIRSNLPKLQRLKIVAIVTIEIHARDVVDTIVRARCKDVSVFEWLSQLRFYWDRDIDDCIIRQTNTHFLYGYEYLGNSGRLVITPLTDRCYITLTTALHLHRGGSPKGPAGTGKTETVKDLGKSLGSYVIVVNCSEGLDYKSMGRMFSGLAQTGAWGCFDEFNRINIEVLSVVAQQILSILQALTMNLTHFIFEGCDTNLVSTCGIFITMNPGYAGRTELPDNLKSMFRPIAMIVPDSAMIAEIILFGEGFRDTRTLAHKVYTLYCLAIQQLSKQDHYDFGLRGLVSLLRYAGRKRQMFPDLPDEKVVLLAMKDMNEAKLTSEDLGLFSGITSDLFPLVEVPTITYEELENAVYSVMKSNGLQPIAVCLKKVIQLYETKNSRHSVMIVGLTGSGKSVTWRTLQQTLTKLHNDDKPGYNVVRDLPVNPKAITLGELYGEFDLATGEWKDGVLSSIMRTVCAEETPDQKWILFDGPVDAVWIENMNSVMDDNKILTLTNSERITMPEQVSLLFEVEDLAVASPATVSRCGMVYNDVKDLGYWPFINSWLQTITNEDIRTEIQQLIYRHVQHFMEYKLAECTEPVAIPPICLVRSLCKLLKCVMTKENGFDPEGKNFAQYCKLWFFFCLLWSVGGSVDEVGRTKVDAFFRKATSDYPSKDSVYEYTVDVKHCQYMNWEATLPPDWRMDKSLPFFKIIVPTTDTVRYQFLISTFVKHFIPCLLLGPVGTGKTSMAEIVLEKLDPMLYSMLKINMSAQTTSGNVQDIIESRLEKRSKGVYFPPAGKKMITLMDDLNMPVKEIYGAQPPLELIRQWLDYGFWYDRQFQTKKLVKDMMVMGAMGPPGGGRNQISNRLLSRFSVINMTFPRPQQVLRIFRTMLAQQLEDFHPIIQESATGITECTIQVYNEVVANMLPTPAKMHYLFNLRDISKIFQGLLRSNSKYITTLQDLLRLWVHECFRVFGDRLIGDKDQEWFLDLLNTLSNKFYERDLNFLCPNEKWPVFGDFMNPEHAYQDLRDTVALRAHFEDQMKEYNLTPGTVHMNLVLFVYAIHHICRIVRVISQPRGNMLLVGVGGTGRSSVSRLALFVCRYYLFMIEVTKTYRLLEFREDLKKLYSSTGVDNRATTFLFSDTQVADEVFLEVINNMLSSGEVPNLYKPDEFDEIKSKLSTQATKDGIVPTTEGMFSYFIDRVRRKLHIIVCMSPVGDAFRNRLRQYPSLISSTTIDWFTDWPYEALLEVADKYLQDVSFLKRGMVTGEMVGKRKLTNFICPQERVRKSVATMFATIHYSVSKASARMLLEMKRHNYVTPTNYLELVAGYKKMLEEKRTSISAAASKLRNGLFKIEDTGNKVKVMSIELQEAKEKVAEYQRQCDEYLEIIEAKRTEADEEKQVVAANKIRIEEEKIVCERLAAIAQADLDEAMPALEEAMRALDALNKRDLSEVKSYGRPPEKVEIVMEAVMILMQVEPTWAEAKRQLGDPNFLNILRDFDKDNISDRTLKKIAVYTSNPEFEPDKVGVVSFACKSLCMWVRAIEKYGKIYRIVAPKRAKLEEAQANLRQKEQAMRAAEARLKELAKYLKKLQKQFELKLAQKEELRIKAEILAQKLERAQALVDGLAGEKARWAQTVANLDLQADGLPGDCLLATGFVSYVGPFVSHYRDELVKSWKQSVSMLEVPCSENFNIIDFLADPTTIREWNIQGLPSDEFSTENGIIVTRCSRWPLLIDPQCQGVEWIKRKEGDKDLQVIDFGQSDYMRTLELAIQFGKPVLLQNVSEVLEPSLTPVLTKSIIKQAGQLLLKLSDKLVQYNPNFRFFITTKMGNPHYPPEICTKTTLVNFAVKQQGLERQLLGIVVRYEKPYLEEQKDSLVLEIAAGRRKLIDLEDELLRLMYETKGSLLDDLQLLITLQTSQATSVAISEQIIVSEKTEIKIDAAREDYRPCATRASILFFVLNDMSQIDPMYQYSLDAYIHLFILSIEKSKASEELEERIEYLNEYHTYAVYKYACRGLFEHHKLLFTFHLCVKILENANRMSLAEYNFLLKGGVVLERKEQADNPSKAWLSEESWDNITELDKLSGFHGLIASFQENNLDWHMWYTDKVPEEVNLVGEWQEALGEFQKMLVVRSLRPDRLSICMTTFIINMLGPKFAEPPVLDIRAVLEDSTSRTPLIFVLSPGVDPSSNLMQLAESVGMAERFQSLSLGQGQAPIATSMIKNGAREGNWVFLANCHLSLSWMPKLDKIVEVLQTTKVHPDFRLWLSSSPSPEFPLSILQAGIKMTTEPPKGLKANLKRLYQLMTEERFTVCQTQHKYRRLLFSLCFFHGILLERKKFLQLGWNVVYSFNDSDFDVAENLLTIYLDEYADQTPWDALKYLIAGVVYGGHVTDDWDRRLLTTYINQYFNDDVLTADSYMLSSLPTYYVPGDGDLASYVEYIGTLPTVELPEVFGQHSNADIASSISETQMMCETLMSLQVQMTAGAGENQEDKVIQLAAGVLEKLPLPIVRPTIDADGAPVKPLKPSDRTPLIVVLLQEVARYNTLLKSIRGSLHDLQKGIKGLVLMSSELEDIFTCIYEGRVPQQWLRAYPSMKMLGSWTRDLVLRIEYFQMWLKTLSAPIYTWLSAFTFPTGMLTAVLQTTARKDKIPIDSLSWNFRPFVMEEYDTLEPPTDGIYVRGLFLEGAGWDLRTMALAEPQPMQLVYPMPYMHFKPVESAGRRKRGIYSCPCYYYPQRCGGAGRAAFVVAMDLASGTEKPDHWIKRGTAILLSLAT
ncbi:dynein axonemal heavy chain 2 [Anabrus simplex]|uniref:dynein axonemal heavy chain 2 n=1 Tax=Anabrus simplex TaxID=316456 RepID=UPI0035A3BE12